MVSRRVSIIMAVMDVEKEIPIALESVLNQTYDDFEVIIVDDGSTDGTASYCEYVVSELNEGMVRHGGKAKVVVVRVPHGGTARARNIGLTHAKGDYIGFVDGDDVIEPDFIECLMQGVIKFGADISACGFIKVSPQAIEAVPRVPGVPGVHRVKRGNRVHECLSRAEAMGAIFQQDHMRYSMCNKLFKRELFQGVSFPEGKAIDDKRTIYKLIERSNKVAWCRDKLYRYVMRQGSVMHHMSREKCLDFLEATDELERFIQDNYPELVPQMVKCFASEATRWLEQMTACGYEDEDMNAVFLDRSRQWNIE